MKKNCKRSGFTTVELVIVIAVIAVLATVLIPTFSGLVTKANDSKAIQQARNAYTEYLIDNNGSAPAVMLYQDGERWVALKNGVPEGVYASQDEALAAVVDSPDENQLTPTANGKLFAYGGEVGNGGNGGNNAGNNGGNNGGNDTPDTPANPTDWSGASVVFVGDSITAGAYADSGAIYYQCLKTKLNLASATAKATGGSCISAQSDYGTNNNPLIGRWEQIPDAELIVIFMGTNDFGHATPLGTISDTTDVSFYGALNVIIPGIQAAHPNSQIVMITPLHRQMKTSGMTSADDNVPNTAGHTLKDYVDAIKAICQKYDLSVIDLYNTCTWDPADTTYFDTDKLHPNGNGHRALADLIAEAMATIPREHERIPTPPENPEIFIEMKLGNALAGGSFASQANRASSTVNLYLKAGTTVTFKCLSNYKYALGKTAGEFVYTKTGDYIPDAVNGWCSTIESFTIAEDGWYGFAIARQGDADLDLGGADSDNLWDYFEIVPPTE